MAVCKVFFINVNEVFVFKEILSTAHALFKATLRYTENVFLGQFLNVAHSLKTNDYDQVSLWKILAYAHKIRIETRNSISR